MDKTQWGDIHINTGILFLVAIALHTYYNWKSIVAYLKNKAKELKVLTPNFNAALIVTLVVILGTFFHIPPFSTILGISEGIKDAAAVKYGEPPYGHAELSNLKSFSKKMKLDYEASLKQLETAGFTVADPKHQMRAIAKTNGVSPQRLFEEMQKTVPVKSAEAAKMMPASPAPGLGKRQLVEVLTTYGLQGDVIVEQLADQGIRASLSATMKEIASQNNISPHDVYDTIRAMQ